MEIQLFYLAHISFRDLSATPSVIRRDDDKLRTFCARKWPEISFSKTFRKIVSHAEKFLRGLQGLAREKKIFVARDNDEIAQDFRVGWDKSEPK